MDFETTFAMFCAAVGLIATVFWAVMWVRGIRAAKELTAELRAQRETAAPASPPGGH